MRYGVSGKDLGFQWECQAEWIGVLVNYKLEF